MIQPFIEEGERVLGGKNPGTEERRLTKHAFKAGDVAQW
jgi:hypothetical protein